MFLSVTVSAFSTSQPLRVETRTSGRYSVIYQSNKIYNAGLMELYSMCFVHLKIATLKLTVSMTIPLSHL